VRGSSRVRRTRRRPLVPTTLCGAPEGARPRSQPTPPTVESSSRAPGPAGPGPRPSPLNQYLGPRWLLARNCSLRRRLDQLVTDRRTGRGARRMPFVLPVCENFVPAVLLWLGLLGPALQAGPHPRRPAGARHRGRGTCPRLAARAPALRLRARTGPRPGSTNGGTVPCCSRAGSALPAGDRVQLQSIATLPRYRMDSPSYSGWALLENYVSNRTVTLSVALHHWWRISGSV
jgi:hypothetical protein